MNTERNQFRVTPEGCYLTLTDRHRKAACETLISTEDLVKVLGAGRWSRDPRSHTTYATRIGQSGEGTAGRRKLSLHRFILGLAPGSHLHGDHINGNGLDNRRCNLRAVTKKENEQNRHTTHAKSEYLNVYSDRRRFVVRITRMGRVYSWYGFKDAESANHFAIMKRKEFESALCLK